MSAEATGWVWRHSPYTLSVAFVVHLAIADVVNDQNGNEFWMLVPNLAEKARAGKSQTSAALADMVRRGLLEVLERGGGRGHPTRYRFLMPELSTPVGTTSESTRPSGALRSDKPSDRATESIRSEPAIGITQGTQLNPSRRRVCGVDNRQPADPGCRLCHGRGTRPSGGGGPDGEPVYLGCECTEPDYQPWSGEATRPPPGFGMPAHRGAPA